MPAWLSDVVAIAAVAFAVSAAIALLLVRFASLHWSGSTDSTVGPQKFHDHTVPRVGGLAVILGIAAALCVAQWDSSLGNTARTGALLLLCALPAMAAGFAEDLSKRVKASLRLGATMVSAAIAYFVLDGVLGRVDVAGLDWALKYGVFSFALTLFAVGGIANAINIIDGYNGLAGMISVFVLAAMAYVASAVGDIALMGLCLAGAAAVAGFLVWNFPRGKIFLGDGGAYFVGFFIAELAVLLVRRNPDVSPWFPFMLVAYPVCETLFSVYRKKVLRGESPGQPDGIHLHMLVFKRVVRWRVGSRNPADRIVRNSLTAPYLWLLSLLTIVPAVAFWNSSGILGFFAFAFVILYVRLYRRL
ncbi:MAG: MraY family glycosyltransferase, partial [Usitatibacter sp.]